MGRSLADDAHADFEAAVDWNLDALAFTVAEDFTNEVEQTVRLFESFPNAGNVSPHKTRLFTLSKFPYRLVYRTESDHIRIIAFAHQRRKPRFCREQPPSSVQQILCLLNRGVGRFTFSDAGAGCPQGDRPSGRKRCSSRSHPG